VIVHRDLKTLNVLVTKDLKCKVADFGLSRFQVKEDEATLAKCRGTYAYIAPEVFRSEGYLVQSDVYSFSIMIWEIVTRCLTRTYHKPFAEYTNLKMDVQVLIQACKLGKRPTIKENTPQILKDLIVETWNPAKLQRPDIDVVQGKIVQVVKTYEENKATWDALIAS